MKLLSLFLLFFTFCTLGAQDRHDVHPIICHHDHQHRPAYFGPQNLGLRSGSANSDFIFNFDSNVPTQARQAMEYAASIWASYLHSVVPIEVEVSWEAFDESGVLASAGPSSIFRDFSFLAKRGVWYPVALAEAIAGTNLNDVEADIVIRANSRQNWYFGLDGNVPRGRMDLVSVILHELGHGLGFLSSADENDEGEGEIGFSTLSIIFDEFIETSSGNSITDVVRFRNPSTNLLSAFTGNALVFADDRAADVNANTFPKLYAPRNFDAGSSISHLDEFAFPTGSENALMSPSLSFQEAIHDPGPVSLAIMQALGWEISLNTVTSTQDLTINELQVYPNPTKDVLQVDWPADLAFEVAYDLFDQYGRLIQRGQLSRGNTLNLSNVLSGTYYLRLNGDTSQYVASLVVID